MNLAIIVGSTRQNRQSIKEAQWVAKTAEKLDGVKVKLIDLVDYPMPFFNEPMSPRYNPNREIDPDVKKWLDVIAPFDAYIFVTPEYNHSIPGVLKNALDFVTIEFVHKPAAVVSHGSVGGARAAVMLKEILSESRAVVIPSTVAFVAISEGIDEEGNLSEEMMDNPYGPQAALKALLDDLQWYSDALEAARNVSIAYAQS